MTIKYTAATARRGRLLATASVTITTEPADKITEVLFTKIGLKDTADYTSLNGEISKYLDENYCKSVTPIEDKRVPDGSILKFSGTSGGKSLTYYVSDNTIFVKEDSSNYLIYTVSDKSPKTEEASADGSIYTISLEGDRSGTCLNENSLTDCSVTTNKPPICPADDAKCINK